MPASVGRVEGRTGTLEVTVALQESLLGSADARQSALNAAGCLATGEALKRLDTDGTPVVTGAVRWRSKGHLPKRSQTPYGEGAVSRHVSQSASGGTTYGPLEQPARLVVTATPQLAQPVAQKLAQNRSPDVADECAGHHGRPAARSYVPKLAQRVGRVAQAQEEAWAYALPPLAVPIETVAVGGDGTGLLLCEDGWREARVGPVSLDDKEGERHQTLSVGATPAYGKARLLARLAREVLQAKQRSPQATSSGLADGAESHGRLLAHHTSVQSLDVDHATGYLGAGAAAVPPTDTVLQRQWCEARCQRRQHAPGAAEALQQEMAALEHRRGLAKASKTPLTAAVTYVTTHKQQMPYAKYQAQTYPIGSGVSDAACKTLVKQRLGNAGRRWTEPGAAMIVS